MSGTGSNPARPDTRWTLLVMAALCVVFGIVYTAFWKAGASAMRTSLVQISDTAGPPELSFGSFSTTGFPFFLRGDVRDVALVGGGYAWRAERLTIDALPINPDRFVFSPAATQRLDLGALGGFDVTTDAARASISRDDRRWIVDAQADRLDAVSAPPGRARLAGHGLLMKASPEGRNGVHASLFAGRFDWSSGARSATGEKLLVDAIVDPSSSGVTISRFSMQTGGATVELDGALALDPAGFPEGVLNARIVNPAGFIGFLAGLGALGADDARAAKAALSLAAMAGGGAVVAPLELTQGEARIAGVRVATLPRLR